MARRESNVLTRSRKPRSTPAPACAVCPDKPGQGWQDKTVTHCRDCHATWPLTKTRWQHCVSCHRTFGGDEAATRHIARDGSCRDPETVLHKVTQRRILTLSADGVWTRAFGA